MTQTLVPMAPGKEQTAMTLRERLRDSAMRTMSVSIRVSRCGRGLMFCFPKGKRLHKKLVVGLLADMLTKMAGQGEWKVTYRTEGKEVVTLFLVPRTCEELDFW